jgi:hypothetical protein
MVRNTLAILAHEDAVQKVDPDHWTVRSLRTPSRRVPVYRRGDLLKCRVDKANSGDQPCSHILAVLFYEGLLELEDTSAAVYRKSDTPRDHALEEKAWRAVPIRLPALLSELLRVGLPPEPVPDGPGRPPKPLFPVVYQAVMRVATRMNLRASQGAMETNTHREHNPWGAVGRSTVSRFLNDPASTKVLEDLLSLTLLPARPYETLLHPDGTGLTTNLFTSFFEEKHKSKTERRQHDWNFCLFVWTYRYTMIAAADIRRRQFGEAPNVIPLFEKAINVLDVKEIGGDKAYDANYLFQWAKERGIDAQFKIRNTGPSVQSTHRKKYRKAKMEEASLDPEGYAARANRRSNAEAGNHAFKAMLGDRVYSRGEEAQRNEILCMCIAYNLARLILLEEASGDEATFRALALPTPSQPVA